MRQLFNLSVDREGKEQKALKISLLYSHVMVVNHSQTKLVAVRLTGRMKTGWYVPKPEQKAKSFFRITHRRQITTLNIGFSSRCIKEMLQNSKVLFPFPDQHKFFLNGPKRIMGRVVVKPIVTRERQ